MNKHLLSSLSLHYFSFEFTILRLFAVSVLSCLTTDVRGQSVGLYSLICSNISNALCSVMDYKTLVWKEWVILRVIQIWPI